jgi:hypothetical protein
MLLAIARDYVQRNQVAARYVDVPAPAGAVVVYDWNDPRDASAAFRYFDGTSRTIENSDHVAVDINGIQYPDGQERG